MAAQTEKRPIIALFVHETYGNHYQTAILSAVLDATRDFGANLICVCGSEFEAPHNYFKYGNLIYQWVDQQNVDGIILVNAIFNYVDVDFQRAYCERLKPLPIRALGPVVGDVPNTTIDNASGLRDVVRHLIKAHGYRRLAFVTGPQYNPDAEERYRIYRDVLAEHGIPFDPDLVIAGDFNYASGQKAVNLIWDEKKLQVDAIIAANDDMAFGVLDSLRERGIKVPDQVAVTGFDDADGASTTTPPLTTVSQPIYRQAYDSVELLLAQIRGESVPDHLVFLTQPVYRRSCGCLPTFIQKTMAVGDFTEEKDISNLQELLQKKQAGILFALREATTGFLGSIVSQSSTLLLALMADLLPEDSKQPGNTFLLSLENALWGISLLDEHSLEWHSLISTIRELMLPILRPYPTALLKAESLWNTAQVLISDRLHQKPVANSLRQGIENNVFRWITRDLITTFQQDQLIDLLADALPKLRITECYVGLYDDINNNTGLINLVLYYRAGKRFELESGGRKFPSPQALIKSLLEPGMRQTLVVETLHFRDERYGFIVLGLNDSMQQVSMNMGLRESIGGGLKGSRLAREVQQHSAKLEAAYQTLHENQQQLIIAEKMASLGRLTAGIAHEMNTPLAAVRAVMSRLTELVQEYESSIGDATVTDEDHHEIADELHAAIQLAEKATERAVGFVRGVKSQTRGLSKQENQSINAVVAVEDTLLLLHHVLVYGKCSVDFQKPRRGDIYIFGASGRIEQIVTNLINNAVDACYPNGGPITVRLTQKSDAVELQVSDKGSGILPENLSKIFDPMFSTKPFGSSTGLGLTIVHDIVVGEFGGSIDVSSVAGKGTTFTIVFPVKK